MKLHQMVRQARDARVMQVVRKAQMALLLAGSLLLTACQSTTISPPPDFEPPVVTPGVQQPPPPTTPTIPAKPGGEIAVVPGNPLIAGPALEPKKPSRVWKYIIVHHSDTPVGCAARFDRAHKARGWEMLGYDFVIGNGSETADGLIEVGPRWTYQLDGAHTGTPDRRFNEYGIGICLVGNFELTRPTAKQMDSLARLCGYMMKKYHIPATNIVGHRDCKPTGCPGKYMYEALPQLRKLAAGYASR